MAVSGRSRVLPADCWKPAVIHRLSTGWRNVLAGADLRGAASGRIPRLHDIVAVIGGPRGF